MPSHAPDPAPDPQSTRLPKKIVLLSDGTGNSSAKLLKTNIWRIYDSLDLADPTRQVACYDNGVGTSSFKPLQLIGGAFGVGLRSNVLRLYRFLCEHYDPGDEIFLFGFSRGAFTVRVLTGLICKQGIIKTRPTLPVPDSKAAAKAHGSADATGDVATIDPPRVTSDGLAFGSELTRLASWAYRAHRREFNQTGGLVTVARGLRDLVLRLWQRKLPKYEDAPKHQVEAITFVGVWDTVDAYGLPLDELTQGIDKWVWPLSMPDLRLNAKVKRACHVLAIDDERNTFHPVLWNEVNEPQNCRHIDDERITQVWFTGMHSNVGGGYADDALSAVSLKWMTSQLKCDAHKLNFVNLLLKHYTAKADLMGRVYDSRSGLKAYYRYNPRKIEWLTNGQAHERKAFGGKRPSLATSVTIERPKIHESVLTRMSAAPEAYAPIVFPEQYAVVMEDGRIVDGASNPFEKPEAAPLRHAAQERVWDFVWYRRVAYYAAVAVTVVLLLRPFRDSVDEALGDPNGGTAGRIVAGIGEWLPSLAQPWIGYFTARPWELFAGMAFLFVMQRIGAGLQARICQDMRGIWLKMIPPVTGEHKRLVRHKSLLLSIRSSDLYQGIYAVLRRKAMPALFGIATLVWLAGAANRAAFEAFNMAGAMCPPESASPVLGVGDSRTIRFASGTFCTSTGIGLESNGRYRLAFRPVAVSGPVTDATPRPERPYRDGGVAVDYSAAGFTSRTTGLTLVQRGVLFVFVPFRRVWTSDWFVPIARIGEQGLSQYAIEKDETTMTARISGELFLFVNDAILPVNVTPFALGWDAYYENNDGSADVTVTRLSASAEP